MAHTAIVALGANLGQRATHIKQACQVLRELSATPVMTSFLYETPPVYVLDQPSFLNAVVKLTTTLTPNALLSVLKETESRLGRVKTRRFGERAIDLDIVLYDDIILNQPDLIIPHPRMAEREFVLRPLCDIAPHLTHPVLNVPMKTLLSSLTPDPTICRVLPVRAANGTRPDHVWPLGQTTRVMGVLNATPDSFSDGGLHDTAEKGLEAGLKMASLIGQNGIIDIGGQSTRPGAEPVPADVEIKRIKPIIEGLRAKNILTPLSVDTTKAEVAKAALLAGADIINDISGGTADDELLKVAAQWDVPIVLMHMRGTPQTMKAHSTYSDLKAALVGELSANVQRALEAGISRWNIIIDPGLGYAKTSEHNVEILRGLSQLFIGTPLEHFPVLVGPSRKKFLSLLAKKTHITPGERDWATAGCVAVCVAGQAEFVRVHNVEAMCDVINVANALFHTQDDPCLSPLSNDSP